jgi:hypothetical protein
LKKSHIKNGFNHLSLQHNLSDRHGIVLRIYELHEMKSIEMDNPNTFKQIGSGLIPTLFEESHIKNGFNHLSLQYNLSHRHRIILRIDEVNKIQSVT